MCKCICSAANTHPSMKHLSVLRAGLPLSSSSSCAPASWKAKYLACVFLQSLLGPSALVLLSACRACSHTLHFCLSCLLLTAECPGAQTCSQANGWGLYHIDTIRYFNLSFLYVSCVLYHQTCFPYQYDAELRKTKWKRMKWCRQISQKHVTALLSTAEASLQNNSVLSGQGLGITWRNCPCHLSQKTGGVLCGVNSFFPNSSDLWQLGMLPSHRALELCSGMLQCTQTSIDVYFAGEILTT